MKINFIDVGVIMSVIVALTILAVGVFVFFVTIQSIPITDTETKETAQEITGDSIFNVIGVVLVVGAVMSVIGIVYSSLFGNNESTHSSLPQKKSTIPIKSEVKRKKKDSFEWGS